MNDFQFSGVAGEIRALLTKIGEDPDREGLQSTPVRYSRFIHEFVP